MQVGVRVFNRAPTCAVSWTLVRAARQRGIENHPLRGWRPSSAVRLATRPSRMVIARVAGPEGKVIAMAQKANGLAHTKWLCKCRIVFTPKYRRKAICNQYRRDPGEILGRLCQWRGVEIIEGHPMPDRVHMPVGIPPEIAVSSSMGYLKGKSSLMMFDRHANLKHKFGNRRFRAGATTCRPSG